MRSGRVLTALVVAVVCGTVTVLGLEIIWFSVAQAEFGSTDPEAYRRWANVPGVEFSARDATLTAVATSRDERTDEKVLEAISQILAVKPVSAGYWLSLARQRLKTGEASDTVMNAWSLSVLTGPNEGNVLPWRGIFGISLWDSGSPEFRNRTIADLAAALPVMTPQQQSTARVLLERKTKESRQDIRARLLTERASERFLPNIGLNN
jgi:hypothetical protein